MAELRGIMLMTLFAACAQPDDSAGPTDTADTSSDTAVPDPCVALGPDDPCCVDSADLLLACSDLDVTTTGTFSRGAPDVTYDEWTLTAADGTTNTLWLNGEGIGATMLPDLSALGEVTVTVTGCGLDGEGGTPGALTILRANGQLAFALGTTGSSTGVVEVVNDRAGGQPRRPASCACKKRAFDEGWPRERPAPEAGTLDVSGSDATFRIREKPGATPEKQPVLARQRQNWLGPAPSARRGRTRSPTASTASVTTQSSSPTEPTP